MWKTTIIDDCDLEHNFVNEKLDMHNFHDALKWAFVMEKVVNAYVNHGNDGASPTSIIRLEWEEVGPTHPITA